MQLPSALSFPLTPTLAWLVDAAADSAGADRFLADLGTHLVADSLTLAGGALTVEVPHPLIARRTWLWRADTSAVIEALGFAPAPAAPTPGTSGGNDAGRRWLASLAKGP